MVLKYANPSPRAPLHFSRSLINKVLAMYDIKTHKKLSKIIDSRHALESDDEARGDEIRADAV